MDLLTDLTGVWIGIGVGIPVLIIIGVVIGAVAVFQCMKRLLFLSCLNDLLYGSAHSVVNLVTMRAFHLRIAPGRVGQNG